MASLYLSQWLWPLSPPKRLRVVPLQVLALGLPRTGTESLREALDELGYHHTYHGFDTMDHPEECVAWCELLHRKENGHPPLDAKAFDSIIGHCEAVTDVPCATFAEDLIKAYPDAKIIINHRPDFDAWEKSVVNTLVKADQDVGLLGKLIPLFERRLFWIRRKYLRIDRGYLWRGDIARNARIVYRDHYERLQRLAPPERSLRWTVQDGWEPLCKFLNRPVPERPFPHRNDPEKLAAAISERLSPFVRRAFINMSLFFATLALMIAWFWVRPLWSYHLEK